MTGKTEKLNTVNGEELLSTLLRSPGFIVDTLLGQGLHILAGSPKVGKSWLALWLAVTVAKGEAVWNMESKQGTTLYLCLEDSLLRIQNRLLEVTEDVPANVHFCTESARIGHGLEKQLEDFLAVHPDTVLIIIDTLQMARGAYDQNYANDYRDLSSLKKLADVHGIAILLIHHLRKEPSDDVFSRISGTTAISGAVDTSLTLVETERGRGEATLYCIGRDIEYGELELERDENNVWLLKRDSRTMPKGGHLVSRDDAGRLHRHSHRADCAHRPCRDGRLLRPKDLRSGGEKPCGAWESGHRGDGAKEQWEATHRASPCR